MKIKDLAVTAGVTSSLISQIENNKANPSVNTLMAIARALDVPISALFEEDNHLEPVVRANNRKMLKTESGVTYYLMTPDMQNHQIGLVYNVFEKGGGGEFYNHEGEEAGSSWRDASRCPMAIGAIFWKPAIVSSSTPPSLTNVSISTTVAPSPSGPIVPQHGKPVMTGCGLPTRSPESGNP
jgi:DNA-binding XRE family transcriptional regulator